MLGALSRWFLVVALLVLPLLFDLGDGWREGHKPGLFRVQGEAITLEAFGQHGLHSFGVFFPLEPYDEVIGVSHEEDAPLHPWLHFFLEPLVEHFMQIDVAQQWADDATLRRAFVLVAECPLFHHACFEPFINGSAYHSILYPFVQHVPQVLVVERVKEPSAARQPA